MTYKVSEAQWDEYGFPYIMVTIPNTDMLQYATQNTAGAHEPVIWPGGNGDAYVGLSRLSQASEVREGILNRCAEYAASHEIRWDDSPGMRYWRMYVGGLLVKAIHMDYAHNTLAYCDGAFQSIPLNTQDIEEAKKIVESIHRENVCATEHQ